MMLVSEQSLGDLQEMSNHLMCVSAFPESEE